MNSTDALWVVLSKNDLNNRHRSWLALLMKVCSYLCYCRCRIGSNHCAIDATEDDCSSRQNSCHLENDS